MSSIVDASEEAQMEAAIRASLSSHCQPAAPSSSSTTSMPSATAVAACIETDSDQSQDESDELETFTGSEDESNDAVTRSTRPGSQERTSSLQRRNFSAVSGRTVSSHQGGSGAGVRSSDGASSSGAAAAAAGVSSPHHPLSATPEDSSLPSTSSSRDVVRLLEDSENENSQGFRESYANTPNSVDILSSRSSEFHMLDSSSNSSSLVSGSLVAVDNDEDTVECDRLSSGQGVGRGDDAMATGSPAWHKHFGDASGKEEVTGFAQEGNVMGCYQASCVCVPAFMRLLAHMCMCACRHVCVCMLCVCVCVCVCVCRTEVWETEQQCGCWLPILAQTRQGCQR